MFVIMLLCGYLFLETCLKLLDIITCKAMMCFSAFGKSNRTTTAREIAMTQLKCESVTEGTREIKKKKHHVQ